MTHATHAHHWLVDSPSPGARLLAGTCKLCGATRSDFPAFDSDGGLFDGLSYRIKHGKLARATISLRGSKTFKEEKTT